MSQYSHKMHNLAANTIRGLSIDGIDAAQNGHPGMPMGMADVAVVLWTQFLKHNPKAPDWPDRDRFILSAGHGSMLMYSLLHLTGYDLPMAELKNFRQWGSLTPGHPENHVTVGVETTTGPLGQGISNGVGFAMAERWLAEHINQPEHDVVDHYTYVIAGDGDMMEGVSHEACSLGGHLGLGKLIVLYDDNRISIDGSTDITFSEDVIKRYDAYDWHTQRIDGHDPEAIIAAIQAAQADGKRPSLIACRTHIGYGAPNWQDTSTIHGKALTPEELKLTKENLGIPLEPAFYVPDGVYDFMAGDDKAQAEWTNAWKAYTAVYPGEAAAATAAWYGKLPDNWDDFMPKFAAGESMATRASSGKTLNALAPHVPYLLGGSADLTGSNNTDIKGEADLTTTDFSGRYIRFGVREHGMGSIMNGMSLHGGIRPYGGTFLVFSDYMRGAIRMAALMGIPAIYVFTHDSVGLGADGPTHQPIEHVMSLRMMPNLMVIRPADAKETAVAWRSALENTTGPTVLVLTRQSVPTLEQTSDAARKGAYILSDVDNPQVILIGTGSELQLALEAQGLLAEQGVAARVVSMPSWELFEAQSAAYKESVLPSTITARVSIEAGQHIGWERYVGLQGVAIGLDRFGASAPYKIIYENLGLTAKAVMETAVSLVK